MFIDGNEGNMSAVAEELQISDPDQWRAYIVESTLLGMPDDQRKSYLESDEMKDACAMNEAMRKTVVRLNKADDLARRVKLACLDRARADGASEWIQLRKVQKRRKQLLAKIAQKYSSRVTRDAIKQQRTLLKSNPTLFTAPIKATY